DGITSYEWDFNNDGTVDSTVQNPSYTYTGNGVYTVTLKVFEVDGNSDTESKSNYITVSNVNQLPVANADTAATPEDTPVTTDVLANDSDADGDTLTVTSVTVPTNGNATINGDNTVTYTPNPDFNGDDSYTYTISDGNGGTDTATVTISIGVINDAPVFDYIGPKSVNENSLLSFTVNASDADGDTLTYSAIDLPIGATFNNSTRVFKWTPSDTQVGPHPVIFKVTDGLSQDSENVTITVKYITSQNSGSSGGGGGGGGSTGEEFDNIEVRDVIRVYINRDSNIVYEFKEELNAIDFVRFDAKTSAGYIAATIEVLKDTSVLVSTPPSGEVYQNMNIWIGNVGYATEDKITNPTIEFKVARSWITENNIDISKIQLCRYSSGVWNPLPTTKKNEDVKHIYFTSKTSGFSPFAITGTQRSNTLIPNILTKNTSDTYFTTPSTSTDGMTHSDEIKGEIDVPHEETKSSRGFIILLASIGLVAIIIFMYFRRDSSWDMP
ncbi:MAG TPA: PGF-pre-PGF domain-containing protein, partial [Methanosarcinaceae archaeon]|nr:PGF-pre-PGF domain-containing protein [Methanosarcinaceae archaeon]